LDPPANQLLYSYEQTAALLGLGSVQALRDMVYHGEAPPHVKLRSRTMFRHSDLVAWVNALPIGNPMPAVAEPAVKRPVGRPTVKSRIEAVERNRRG
jgi:Helix-turn-helix domain